VEGALAAGAKALAPVTAIRDRAAENFMMLSILNFELANIYVAVE
jgi:hypothetical protein